MGNGVSAWCNLNLKLMNASILRDFLISALSVTGYRIVDERHISMAIQAAAEGKAASFFESLEQRHALDAARDDVFLPWFNPQLAARWDQEARTTGTGWTGGL